VDSILDIQNLSKRYGDHIAVDDLSFSVPRGSVFGLLGPNGAGKTTTIRMVMRIIAADSGTVLLDGQPVDDDRRRIIGYLPEERGLYKKMKVLEHLVYLGTIRGIRPSEAKKRAAAWLERFDLGEWATHKVEDLSKGMQQKIQLIGTILHDPDLLILDEPFSGLDPINQGLFKELLADYQRQGKTIIFSTHIMEQAEKLCDCICLISQGRTILEGELPSIKRRLGGNSYRLVADGDLERIDKVTGVQQALFHDGSAKLLLEPDASGSDVLRELVGFLSVHEFRSQEPDLEEIFIKAVRDATR
jgi:ABC-2 type transport system ATP-binding protein